MRHGLLLECAERTEKKRGKCLFSKHLPRISLIISIFRLFLDGSLRGSFWCFKISEFAVFSNQCLTHSFFSVRS